MAEAATETETLKSHPDPAAIRLGNRRDRMREIANAARQARTEGLDPADKPEIPAAEPPAEPPIQAAEPEPPAEPPAAEPSAEPPKDPEPLVAVQIDGVDQKITVAEAERLLADRSRAERELAAQEARRKELEEMQQPPAVTPAPAPDLLPLAREAVSAILDSTEEEAAEKLVTVLGNLRPEPIQIDTQAIAEQAAERAAPMVREMSEAENRQHAIDQFRTDRKDIFDDPILYAGFDQYATAYHNEHPDAPPAEVLAKAAESVDNWKAQFVPASPPVDTEFAEKERRKAAATENVSQISDRQRPPPEKKPLTTSEIIAQKQKARGRPMY